MKKMIMIMAAMTLLSACVKKTSNNENKEPGQSAMDNQDLVSYEDKARGVVCYRVDGRTGLSCVVVSTTK